jgi:hypothetical protein
VASNGTLKSATVIYLQALDQITLRDRDRDCAARKYCRLDIDTGIDIMQILKQFATFGRGKRRELHSRSLYL